jgi:hypothetical protein
MVKVLSSSEKEAVAGMLARAFSSDPLAQYVFPEDAIRRQRLVSVYRLYLRVFEQKGLVSTNDDRTHPPSGCLQGATHFR